MRGGPWRAGWWGQRGAGGVGDACVGTEEERCEMKRPRAVGGGRDPLGHSGVDRLVGAERTWEAAKVVGGAWQHP